MARPIFSLIIPTRQRTAQLERLLNSLAETAKQPGTIEVVLVVDADDPASHYVGHSELTVIHVIVRAGLSMGALNDAGYRAATGQFLMLLNDDVVARTPGWDEQILSRLERFPDGI